MAPVLGADDPDLTNFEEGKILKELQTISRTLLEVQDLKNEILRQFIGVARQQRIESVDAEYDVQGLLVRQKELNKAIA